MQYHIEGRGPRLSFAARPFTVRPFTSLARVVAVEPAPCGRWLAIEVLTPGRIGERETRGLWRVEVDGLLPPRRLQTGTFGASAPKFRRDGALGFLGETEHAGGLRRRQVWLLSFNGEPPKPLTQYPGDVESFRFSSLGSCLVFLAKPPRRKVDDDAPLRFTELPMRKDGEGWARGGHHFHVANDRGGPYRDLSPEALGEYTEADWDLSPDGRWVVTTSVSPGSDLHPDTSLRLLGTGDGSLLAEWGGDRVSHEHPRFAPDGARVAVCRHLRQPGSVDRPRLWVYEARIGAGAASTGRELFDEGIEWPRLHSWSCDGKELLVTSFTRGVVPVYRVTVDSTLVHSVCVTDPSKGGAHDAVAQIPNTNLVCGIRHALLRPPEPFACCRDGSSVPRALAHPSEMREEECRSVACVEPLSVAGSDGIRIGGFVMRPRTTKGRERVVLWLHGGPVGCFADEWRWQWNPLLLAAQGYTVVLPNPRGSIGYGQSFVEGVWNNRWGAECHEDVLAVIEAVTQWPSIAAGGVVAMGASFGGYLCNLLAATCNRVKAVVSHAGPFHLSSLYGESDIPGWRHWEMGMDPYSRPDIYDRHSPHRYLSQWHAPALFTHGGRDSRVPVAQSLRAMEALRRRGVPAELVIYPAEGHRLCKQENVIHWYETVLTFLRQHTGEPEVDP